MEDDSVGVLVVESHRFSVNIPRYLTSQLSRTQELHRIPYLRHLQHIPIR